MPSWSSLSANEDEAAALRRFVEASRRAEIIALVNSARSEEEVARSAASELCEALEAEVAFVLTTTPGVQSRTLVAQVGLTSAQAAGVPYDRLCTSALGSARAQAHAGEDLLGAGARRALLAPWTTESGRQVVLGVARLSEESFAAAELALVDSVAESVGHALERQWLGAERDRHAARQGALARTAKALSAALLDGQVLDTLCAEVAAALEADVVLVCGSGECDIEAVAAWGMPPAVIGTPCGSAQALGPRAIRTGAPVVAQPFEGPPALGLAGVDGLRSGLAAPLRRQGAPDGALVVGYKVPRWIADGDAELLVAFAELAAIASRTADAHAAARRAATLDSLTDCLNHGAFQARLREEVTRAERTGRAPALVLLDLDGFKEVNDRLGHLGGDALLRSVAEVLRSSVRAYDQVGRLGGDEFGILLPATEEEAAQAVVDRAQGALRRVPVTGGAAVSASAGLACWQAGEDADRLLERADAALFDRKHERRGDRGARRTAGVRDREQHRLRRLVTVGALGTRLARLLDQRTIGETAIAELAGALGGDAGLLVRADPGGLWVVAAVGAAPWPSERGAPPLLTGAVRRCIDEHRTVLAPDVAGDPAYAGEPGDGVRAELAVPVHVGAELWGALVLRADSPGAFDEHDAQLAQGVAAHMGAALRTADLYDKLEQTSLGTAEALAAALEAKDTYTADHARSLAELAVTVGRELGLEDAELRDLRYGAIFHDIGKIAVPDAILNKPGPLTAAELEIVKMHPLEGERILAPVPFLAGVRRIVRHDHERWDGKGYPDRLAGEAIPLGARIVLAVDAFHAMTSDRPYRLAMPVEDARAELARHAGTQFDPRVVAALLTVLDRGAATG